MKTGELLDGLKKDIAQKLLNNIVDQDNLIMNKLEATYYFYAKNKRKTNKLLAIIEYKEKENRILFLARNVTKHGFKEFSLEDNRITKNIPDLYNQEIFDSFMENVNKKLLDISSYLN